ncbi:MAG: two-component regulator propeller domain-containing protein, partial [Halobacteriales archaeon]|nr:two-component regulator propeller domain-containing protein [Halobacteriales archaeon]
MDGEIRRFGPEDGLAAEYAYSLTVDSSGFLWVGSRTRGVTRCRIMEPVALEECEIFDRDDGLGHDTVRAIVEDDEGTIYLGTRGGGVARWDGAAFTRITTADGLAGDDVYALLINRRNELVVGTSDSGVTLCPLPLPSPCRTVSQDNGLATNGVLNLYEDRVGTLWIALNNGLSRLHTEKFYSYRAEEELPGSGAFAVEAEPSGEVWVGTYGGLVRIREGSERYGEPELRVWTKEDGLPSSEIWDVHRDRWNRLWVATSLGLCRFDPDRGCVRVLDTDDGLPTPYGLDLIETREGDLWLGTTGGVARLETNDEGRVATVSGFTPDEGLAGLQVHALVEDSYGNLWIGSYGSGLTSWDGKRFRTYDTRDGLPTDSVYELYAAE